MTHKAEKPGVCKAIEKYISAADTAHDEHQMGRAHLWM